MAPKFEFIRPEFRPAQVAGDAFQETDCKGRIENRWHSGQALTMKAVNIEDALHARPFRPFTVEIDNGKRIPVKHMDFLLLSPGKGTAIIFETKERFSIVGVENISAISFE